MSRQMRTALIPFLIVIGLLALSPHPLRAQDLRVGTWKTAQTIQPFFYQRFLPDPHKIRVFSFTNPADQKMALLAGSLDMCGTTLAHAIHSASRAEPVVLVASLCNKCSALVVKKGGPVKTVTDLRGKKIGYVPGTMHEILLREVLTRNAISPEKDVRLTRVDFFDMGLAFQPWLRSKAMEPSCHTLTMENQSGLLMPACLYGGKPFGSNRIGYFS